MKKFALYFVESNSDFDKSNATVENITKEGFACVESDGFEELLKSLITEINRGLFSDENWYFVIDVEKQIILMQ